MMTTETLSDITRVEAEAQAAAQKAFAAAETARAKADAARERAEREREVANKSYMDLLTSEHPAARVVAVERQAEAHQDLDLAVRNGEDVFVAYRGWVDASIRAWELDEELGRMRRFHGVNMRETPAPTFDFGIDIGAILDQVSLELQDQAIARIDARRASYLSGKASS